VFRWFGRAILHILYSAMFAASVIKRSVQLSWLLASQLNWTERCLATRQLFAAR